VAALSKVFAPVESRAEMALAHLSLVATGGQARDSARAERFQLGRLERFLQRLSCAQRFSASCASPLPVLRVATLLTLLESAVAACPASRLLPLAPGLCPSSEKLASPASAWPLIVRPDYARVWFVCCAACVPWYITRRAAVVDVDAEARVFAVRLSASCRASCRTSIGWLCLQSDIFRTP